MHPYVRERLPQIVELCRKYHVKRLDLFGSGTGERFDPARSDLDFVVEYLPEADAEPLHSYFGFKDGLAQLFGREIDLVEPGGVKNRYFRAELEHTRVPVYAA